MLSGGYDLKSKTDPSGRMWGEWCITFSLPVGKKLKGRMAGIGDFLKEDYNCLA